ncbi:MAG: class I SAM-dependent methyltransferase [Gammaproteobacteria bacterium]
MTRRSRIAAHCPVCSTEADTVSNVSLFSAHRCGFCQHRFIRPVRQAVYGSGYDGYRDDPVVRASVGNLFDQHIMRLSDPPGEVLDVGCGNGVFLEVARDRGYRVRGVDISESATRLCADKGISALTGEFIELPPATLGTPDVITFWDVVEHLPSPIEYLQRAAAILAVDGLLLVKVPRTGEFSFRIGGAVPRLSGAVLHVPSHVQFFTENSMAMALARGGFEVIEMVTPGATRGAVTGGSWKRRIGRNVTRVITTISHDGNLLALARIRKTSETKEQPTP